MVGTETGSGDNGSAITGNVKFVGIYLSLADGFIQEAGTEDSEQQTIGLFIGREGSLRKTGNEFSNRFLFNGSSLLPFAFWFLDLFPYRGLVVGRKVGRGKVPQPFNEVVKGSNARDIPGLESAENSKEM